MMDRKLRFCMVTTFYPPYNFGGDGIYVHRLSNELAARGHKVEVMHCRDAYRIMAGREPDATYDDHPNVTVHGLKSPFGLLSPMASQQTGLPLFKSRAIREILEQEFDVIHYHNISLLGPKVLQYGHAIKLYTMHEYWLVCPTHILFKFNREACIQPNCLACTLAHKRPPQWWRYSGLLKAAVRHVDLFLAPSRFSLEKHREMGFSGPMARLPLFAREFQDPTSPSELPITEASGTPYFLFVGRLEKLKGLQTLIPIFQGYAKAQLLIAGTGDYERQLRALASNTTNIQFLGRLARPQLRWLYRHAVALILPSLCYEAFPLVLIEAFQQRVPVIARNWGASAEIIEESGGGIMYQSEQDLVAAMDLLLEGLESRQTFGERGYLAYRRLWTSDVHLQRYFSLIQEITTSYNQQQK
jgi:glycosyltransferase involved in cell wall biosynthesis